MPTYEFHCPKCKQDMSLILSLKEYENKKYKCPQCGEDAKLHRIVSGDYGTYSHTEYYCTNARTYFPIFSEIAPNQLGTENIAIPDYYIYRDEYDRQINGQQD